MARYVLKNISRYDVNLSDVICKIPAGKSVDLLAPKKALNLKYLEKSRTSGAIRTCIDKGYLIEIEGMPKPVSPPPIEDKTKNPTPVVFPSKVKSYITIDIGDISDEDLKDMTTNEEDDVLKQLESESAWDEKSPTTVKGE